MNKDRLIHLLHIAKNLPINKLDMGLWGGGNCGTAACLAGWACRDEQFNAQGLTFAEDKLAFVPTFDGETSFKALDKFFDLHGLETTHLFSGIAYSSERPARVELLDHINDILAGDFEKKFGTPPAYLVERRSEGPIEAEKETI